MISLKEKEKYLAFNNYAKFVSEKFGVTVVFDGTNAHTDGSTITLPNLIGMSDSEIDFLYCILLHEVGHIRHSDFSEKAFSKVKSENHFLLANSIEDARIENLLMNEFDGAEEIFSDLYNKYSADSEFISRIFGFNLKNIDKIKAVSIYVHQKIIKLKTKLPLETVIGKKLTKTVRTFVSENEIDRLIEESKLSDWDDVISLTDKIYGLIFKNRKDKSESVRVLEQKESKEKAEELLKEEIRKFESITSDKVKEISANLKSKKTEYDSKLNEITPDITKIDAELNELDKEIESASSILDLKRDISEISDKINKKSEKSLIKEKKAQELEKSIDELTKTKPESKKLLAQKESLEKTKARIEKLKKEISSYEEERAGLLSEIQKHSELFWDKSYEDLDTHLAGLTTNFYSKINKKSEIKKSVAQIDEEIKSLTAELKRYKNSSSKELMEKIIEIESLLTNSGIKGVVLPEFSPTPGWEEFESVQKEFDKTASIESGSVVTNGEALSKTGPRDLILMMEKSNEKLKELNISDIFKKKNKVSKFDNFNSISEMKGCNDPEILKVGESERRHVPLTTEFDVVKSQKTSDGKTLEKVKTKNNRLIEGLSNIIGSKLKFKKRNTFKSGQEDGSLDNRSLWKLATKTDSNFFEQTTPRYINEVSATIAIDLSGSMEGTNYGDDSLRELAVILSDSLSRNHIEHEVVGYHAPVNTIMSKKTCSNVSYNRTSNNLETIIYKGFSDRTNSGIQNIKVYCSDNSDGESLLAIAMRLKKTRSKRKVIFVVTDGRPYLSGSDSSVLDQNLKDTIRFLKSQKIELIGISFDGFAENFYEKFIKLDNLTDIVDGIRKVI